MLSRCWNFRLNRLLDLGTLICCSVFPWAGFIHMTYPCLLHPMYLLESHGPRSDLNYMCCVLSCSVVSDSLWPHGLQPIRLLCSCGFSKQEYWSGLPFPSPGNLPDPWTEPTSPDLAGGFFTTVPPGKPIWITPPLIMMRLICHWSCLCREVKLKPFLFSSLLMYQSTSITIII